MCMCNLEKKTERIHVNVNNGFTWEWFVSFYMLLLCLQVFCIGIYTFFYKKENKTKIKMTKLDPEKTATPTYVSLPLCSFSYSHKENFFPPTRSSAFRLFPRCIPSPPPHASLLSLHSLHFWWEENWLDFLILMLPPLTSCTEKALQHESLPTAARCERWIITSVWLRAWHLLYTGGGVCAQGQGCSVDEAAASHWQTTPKWSQGQATRIHFSVPGWRETQQWSDRAKGQYVSAAKACFDL